MSKSSVDPRAERAKLAAAVRETLIVANQLRRVAESYGSGPEAYDVAREAGDAYEAAFAAYAAHVHEPVELARLDGLMEPHDDDSDDEPCPAHGSAIVTARGADGTTRHHCEACGVEMDD